ncbi:serine hydrolase domain-containing protein [Chryseolinea soli]|uniref:Class A beta-lactamase-related serine hydrolase n=1 Tax=Chryseolinea soli TaxID=2321403 RepID=A0A385SLU7_9BACT|nr:serine hydrolase domain-containing protein [Chryseolinea soli]AYB30915.1 class A beta-lactamase-related serine hydrolase [Chryseolinea soli]
MQKRLPTLGLIGLLSLFITPRGFSEKRPPGKYKRIQKYLDQATRSKLAGVVVYIQSPKHGEWIIPSGYANLEKRTALQGDHIFSLASIGKMYNAVAVLKLVEEGRLKLDDKIADHLPVEIIRNLPNATEVTLRHLLRHASGFVNYEKDPELIRQYVSGQLKLDMLSHLDALRKYVFGKAALFKPGEKYSYSSTNYLLLAMIVDKVIPEGHSEYLRELIREHGFSNTYYRQTPPQKNVNYYGDLNQDGVMDDLTAQTIETTNWFAGDDGVYAPIGEAAHFLQALMKGKILNERSLKEMQTWNNARKPDYGLGLMADKSFPYGLLMGHSGRGIGVTTDLYYFPKQDMAVAIFCNTGLRGSAPLFSRAYLKMRGRIVKKLFLF